MQVAGTLARSLALVARIRPRAATVLHGLALLTGYACLAAWLTWPRAAELGSLPSGKNPFDLYYSAWVLAHESHALVSPDVSLAGANIYHPAENALFYGPAAMGALPLFAPVFLATSNAALAINLTFLLGIALTGLSMHLVVRRWTGSDLAGVVGAATVVVNQWLTRGFVATTPHWAALFWLPAIALLAATRMHSTKGALLLAFLVAVQSLTDFVYVTPAVLAPLLVLGVLRLARARTRPLGLRTLMALVLATLALVPLLESYLAVRAANPDLATQTNWTITEDDLPARLSEQWGGRPGPFVLTPVALGLIVLGIGAHAWRRRTGTKSSPPDAGGWTHGALWAVVGAVMALTPIVLVGGRELLSPIGQLFAWFPSSRAIRVPSRLGITGLVGLGILSGVAFAEVTMTIRALVQRRRVALGLSGVLAALVLCLIHRAYDADRAQASRGVEVPAGEEQSVPRIPEAFQPILESARTPLIELPLGEPVNPHGHAIAMLHSISHWRPLLNGYSSYWPAGFRERMELASRLPAQDALDQLVESTGLALVWVHGQWLQRKERAAWLSPPNADGARRHLRLVARDGLELLFAVEPPPVLAPAGG